MRPAVRSLTGFALRGGDAREITRALPEETAVAMVYNGTTQAVMMASPEDLREFGYGFSLTEGLIARPDEITSLEIVPQARGIEVRMWLSEPRAEALAARRRFMAGPVGCGLCGVDSLEAAVREIPTSRSALRMGAADVDAASEGLRAWQPLHDQTRAVHAAAFFRPGDGILAAHEDVGRHNALDKLIGALALKGIDGTTGAAVLTSRVSVEMVQKSAVAGFPVIVAVSAPTAHAVRLAEGAGITLAVLARGQGFEILSHPHRIGTGDQPHVA